MKESSKLYARFLSKSNYDLIEILESKEDYTIVAAEVAYEIVQERKIEQKELEQLATRFWTGKFESEIKQFLKSQNIPRSNFIQESELKNLMKEAYQDYLQKKESMGVDSTKYWFV